MRKTKCCLSRKAVAKDACISTEKGVKPDRSTGWVREDVKESREGRRKGISCMDIGKLALKAGSALAYLGGLLMEHLEKKFLSRIKINEGRRPPSRSAIRPKSTRARQMPRSEFTKTALRDERGERKKREAAPAHRLS